MTRTIQIGSDSITIPASCPQPELFRDVFLQLLKDRFPSMEAAAEALAAWKTARIVPEPFASNKFAADHYLKAVLWITPKARAWSELELDILGECLPFEDDGDPKPPAIPGWFPDFYTLVL